MFPTSLRKLAAAALAAFALGALASPASARPSYPLKAPEYKEQVKRRVESLWEGIEKKLDFHNVTSERKKAIRKMLDEEARPMWVEVERASADGNITRDEALKIREMQTTLRGKLRARMAAAKKAESAPPAAPTAKAGSAAATPTAKAAPPAAPAKTAPAAPAAKTAPAAPVAKTAAPAAKTAPAAPGKAAPPAAAKTEPKAKPADKPGKTPAPAASARRRSTTAAR